MIENILRAMAVGMAGTGTSPQAEAPETHTSSNGVEPTSQSKTGQGSDLANIDGDQATKSILNGLATPAIFIGTDGLVENINTQALDLFNTTEAEVVGSDLGSYHDADSNATDFATKVLRTEKNFQQVQETIKIDGTKVVSERSATPVYDGDNELVGVLELNRDVTERQQERNRKEILEDYQQRVLDDLQDNIGRLARGDLTIDPATPEPYEGEDFDAIQAVYDEFTDTNDELRQAVNNIRDLVNELQSLSNDMADTSQDLGGTTEEVTASIQQISASSDEVTQGAEDLADKAQTASGNVTDLSSSIEEITATLQEIDAQADKASSLSVDGVEDVSAAVDQIEDAVAAMDEIEAAITSLDSQMKNVGEITEVISDIADQTNLLALNANIEAARADDSGDGFAVVADEVKNLADESQQSTTEITQIIEEAQTETAAVTEQYETVNDEITKGVNAVESVANVLNEIESEISKTSESVAETSDAAEAQAKNAEEISAVIEDTSAMTQQITGSMQEVAAGVDQQSAAMDEVAEMAQVLSQRADSLQAKADEFKVDTDQSAGLNENPDGITTEQSTYRTN